MCAQYNSIPSDTSFLLLSLRKSKSHLLYLLNLHLQSFFKYLIERAQNESRLWDRRLGSRSMTYFLRKGFSLWRFLVNPLRVSWKCVYLKSWNPLPHTTSSRSFSSLGPKFGKGKRSLLPNFSWTWSKLPWTFKREWIIHHVFHINLYLAHV